MITGVTMCYHNLQGMPTYSQNFSSRKLLLLDIWNHVAVSVHLSHDVQDSISDSSINLAHLDTSACLCRWLSEMRGDHWHVLARSVLVRRGQSLTSEALTVS